MLNKPKNEQPLKRTPSAAPNRRPKRCYLCKKNFAFDKYQQHFEQCYRFENQRLAQNRARTNIKPPAPNNTNNNTTSRLKKGESVRKSNVAEPENAQNSNKFRIKNTSNLTEKPKINTIPKKPDLQHSRNKKQVQIKRQIKVQQKEEIKQEKQEQRQILKEEQPLHVEETVSVNPSTYSSALQQAQRRSPFPHHMEDDSQDELIGLEEVHHREGFQIQPQPRRQQIQPPRPIEQIQPRSPNNQRPALISSMFGQDEQQQIPNEQTYDIQSVIINSNSIIEFIRGMNFMQEDQTLNIMVSQLQQLNQIAEQIAQLNQIGRSLAFRMGNVFAARIHHLQTAIINQIGIALIRGFNDRLGVQFQNLTQIQPDLKVGFSEDQIQNLFPQKFNITEKQCSICLEDMKRSQLVMQLQCNHTFHPSCIKQWLISSKKCPMCRCLQRSN